jgi:DNA-binding XRE family transcriptional regulator
MSQSTELGTLSRGERLFIDRRRRGEGQTASAKRLKVTRRVYNGWELDKEQPEKAPVVAIGKLQAHERCVLYRRRSGKTQAACAKKMKLSRWWFNQMERGDVDCTELCGFWEQ